MAKTACDQYESCKTYGADQKYAVRSDCTADWTSRFTDAWPEDKCGSGKINNDRFAACAASVKTYVCGADIGSGLAALLDCNADKVCTDPAN